jgi:chromosome segregation ATPase
VNLGPRINFIVGENGSGKSAVLTAICLTLGAKRSKERTTTGVKGYIREGATSAKLEVTIRNVGADALDVGVYGASITVERTITAAGASTFKIRNFAGKDVGHSKEQLTQLTDHFNIDVDNPIVVMSQDASRQFLHSGKDADKFQFFIKATLLDDITNRLAYIKGKVAEMTALVTEKEGELPQVGAEVRRLEEEADSFAKMEEYLANVEQLRNRLAWSMVYEEEQLSAKLVREDIDFKTKTAPQLAKKLEAEQAKETVRKAESDEAKERLEESSERARTLTETKRTVEAKHKEMERGVRRADTTKLAHENTVKDQTQTAAALEDSIASARMSAEQQSQAQDASIRRAIDQANERRRGVKAELDAISARDSDLRREAELAQGEESAARREMQNLDNAIRDVNQNLSNAQRDDGNQLTKFGRGMPKLAQLLQQHAGRFSKPPLGPIGMHIKLKEAQWALPVEEHFGGFFGGFVVANMKDRTALDKLMRECGCPPNINVANFNLGRYQMPADRLPPAGLVTMMNVVEIDHPAVFNVVVDNCSIERVVLVPDEGQARGIVYNGAGRQPNVKEAYTFHRKLWQKGQSQFENPFKQGLVPRLAADKTETINHLTRQREDLTREMVDKQARLAEARRSKDGLKRAQDEVRRHRREAQSRLDAAGIAVEDAKVGALPPSGPHLHRTQIKDLSRFKRR